MTSQVIGAAEEQLEALKSAKILLVDDEPFIRNVVKHLLQKHGARSIVEAPNGKEALKACEEVVPDIIITDIHMPVMDGLTFIKSVRSGLSPIQRETPIVILTSVGAEHALQTAMSLDADAFVEKGEGLDTLIRKLERAREGGHEIGSAEIYASVSIPAIENLSDVQNYERFDGGSTRIRASDLTPGQELDRNILTMSGKLLLTEGEMLTPAHIKRLSDIDETFGLRWEE